MPYIKKALRKGALMAPLDPGELNYAITMMVQGYVKEKKLCYQTINDVVGALEGAKAEFQRRVVVPYEKAKCANNGDVYE